MKRRSSNDNSNVRRSRGAGAIKDGREPDCESGGFPPLSLLALSAADIAAFDRPTCNAAAGGADEGCEDLAVAAPDGVAE